MAVSGLIQITNISSFVSPQQVKELMSYLGDIVELRVFPERYMFVIGIVHDGCISRMHTSGILAHHDCHCSQVLNVNLVDLLWPWGVL